jgi:hypothetical protein
MTSQPETKFNIYCDESCHLEHDGIAPMVLGAVMCPAGSRRAISEAIWKLKTKHGLTTHYEAKWTSISPSKSAFYLELVEYFFQNSEIRFRAVVIPDKKRLDHTRYSQTHDDFYYKMYFRLVTALFDKGSCYRIFLDIKDTRGFKKTQKLHEVLCNAHLDFDHLMIEEIQQIRSHEVELMQLTDIFAGALGYQFRGLQTSATKLGVIQKLKDLSGLTLSRSTLLSERKFNLFVWEGQDTHGTP